MKYIIILAYIIFPLCCFAQKDNYTVDLEKCLKLAESNSYKLKAGQLSVLRSKKEVELAKLNRIPDFSYSAMYEFILGTNFDPVTNDRTTATTQTAAIQAQLRVPIYINGEKEIKLKKSIVDEAEREGEYQESRFQFDLDVIDLYVKHLYFEALLDISQKVNQTSLQIYSNSRQKYNIGAIAKDELILSNSSYLEDQNKLLDLKHSFDVVNDILKEYIGINSSKDSLVLRPDTLSQSVENIYNNSFLDRVVDNNYLVNIQNQKIAIAKLEESFSRQRAYPQVYLAIGSATEYDQYITPIYGNFNQQIRNNLGYYFGVGTTFSITNLITRKKYIEQSQLAHDQQVQLKNSIQRDLHIKIGELITSNKTMAEKMARMEVLFNNIQQVYQMAVTKLEMGKISQFDFLQVKSKYLEITANYITTKYGKILNYKTLQAYNNL